MICFDIIGIFLDGLIWVKDKKILWGIYMFTAAPYLLNLICAFCFLAFYYKSLLLLLWKLSWLKRLLSFNDIRNLIWN